MAEPLCSIPLLQCGTVQQKTFRFDAPIDETEMCIRDSGYEDPRISIYYNPATLAEHTEEYLGAVSYTHL